MQFATASRRWRVTGPEAEPGELLRTILEEAVAGLPPESLGHAKGYVEHRDGVAFASTTIVPPDITVHRTSNCCGPDEIVHLTLVFADLDTGLLAGALERARARAEACWNLNLIEVQEDSDGS